MVQFQKEISFLLPTIKFQTAERPFCRGEVDFRVLKMESHMHVLLSVWDFKKNRRKFIIRFYFRSNRIWKGNAAQCRRT